MTKAKTKTKRKPRFDSLSWQRIYENEYADDKVRLAAYVNGRYTIIFSCRPGANLEKIGAAGTMVEVSHLCFWKGTKWWRKRKPEEWRRLPERIKLAARELLAAALNRCDNCRRSFWEIVSCPNGKQACRACFEAEDPINPRF